MERNRLILDFDAVAQKVLGAENVVALGETFDVLMRGVTFERELTLGLFADGSSRPVWVHEGRATSVEGGCGLRGLRIATEEAQALFSGGAAFRMAALTVTTTGNDEVRDYGFARVRLYAGGVPDGKYPPAELVDQVADHNQDVGAHPFLLGRLAEEAAARARGDEEGLSAAKAYTDAQTARVYRFMGSVDTVEELPDTAVDGNVYNVRADGMNYAWSAEESRWDALGPTIDLSGYATTAALNTVKARATESLYAFDIDRADGDRTPVKVSLNNIDRGGLYYVDGSAPNVPLAKYDCILLVSNSYPTRGDYVVQIAITQGYTRKTGRIFRRSRFKGAWGTWMELTTREIADIEGLQAALDAKADVEGGALFDPKLLYRAQETSAPYDSNGVFYGHYGPFSMLGCEGAYVVPKTIGIRRRSGATFPGGDTPLYLRVLRAVNGAWVVAYQSENAVRLQDTAADGAPIGPWEMRPVGEVSPIPVTEPVAIVATASKDAVPYDCVQFGAKSSAYAKGGLSGPIGQNPATHPIVAFTISFDIGYSVIRDFADYLPLTGGTVNGPLRMTAPAVSNDPDDPSQDIVFVPTANGEHLQVQFPGGGTALVRGSGGTLATVAELNQVGEILQGDIGALQTQVNAKADASALEGYLPLTGGTVNGHLVAFNQSVSDTLRVRGIDIRATLEKKQNKLIAGDNVTLEPQADGTVKVSATGGGGDSPEGTAHWGSSSYGASFGYTGGSGISISGSYSPGGIDGSTFQLAFNGTNPETETADAVILDVPTKGYVDNLVGNISAALAEV